MITFLLSRVDLMIVSALVVTLGWVALAFWATITDVGDDVAGRLDALAPRYEFTDLANVSSPTQPRDYSSDRGPAPVAPRRYASIYDELVATLGLNPLGDKTCAP